MMVTARLVAKILFRGHERGVNYFLSPTEASVATGLIKP